VPIPVYAEMSSINPVLLMPQALKARGAEIGAQFAQSLTMGAGQFCTNPGLVLAVAGEGLDAFVAAASGAVAAAPAQVMLTGGIRDAYTQGTAALAENAAVETLATGPAEAGLAGSALFRTTATQFLADQALGHEVFGAASVIVVCADEAEMRAVLQGLEGQLTATLQIDPADEAVAQRLLPVLERKVGRILVNGWPTGVEVCEAMVHGGPYPATSDGRTTSVGTLAIDRFLRPVCYQNFPTALLPAELKS
jgi:NADP-dependent aldehyde dehydrogenase